MQHTTDVLIIGAGPSGLTLANILAEHHVPFRLIDADESPTNQSRATIVHIRTLEYLDKLELAHSATAQAEPVRGVNILTRGRPVARFPFESPEADPSPFPHPVSLVQGKTERLLQQGLHERGGDVEWSTTLVGLTQHDDGIRAVLRTPDGHLDDVRARYLVGTDGARSLVRRLLNIPFPGSTYEATAFLADVVLEPAYKRDQLNLNLSNYGFVGIIPISDGRVRLFGALSPSYAKRFGAQDEGRAVPAEDIQQWFTEYFHLPNRVTRTDWSAIYRIHQRLADSFHIGRCFLVGDAFNLGWKLASVLRGEAHKELLDTYAPERRPVAQTVLNGADRGFELEATKNPLMEVFRLYLLPSLISLTARTRIGRRTIIGLFSQTWIQYRASKAVAQSNEHPAAPRAGDRAPYGTFEAGSHQGQGLYERLRGTDHVLLVFEGLQTHAHLPTLILPLGSLLDSYRVKIRLEPISTNNRALHQSYGAQHATVALVRPDGHLAYLDSADDLESLRQFLDQWYLPRRQGVARTEQEAAQALR